jgi:anti-sigma regulatory factor (Ser/Thr protein kinase)
MTDLSLHLMDIMQNSLTAGASCVEVGVKAQKSTDLLTLYVRDNGSGMTEETLKRVSDPFYTTRTTRKAGLGIPLFKASAEMAGGDFRIESAPGKGTTVTATYEISNIDRKPLGSVADTVTMCIMGHPGIEFHLILENEESSFVFRTEEVREQIGDVPVNDPVIIGYLKEMIEEQSRILFGGILNEIIS